MAKDRTTRLSRRRTLHDRWKGKGEYDIGETWTGPTSFKILLPYRQLAAEYFYQASDGHQAHKGAPKAKARKEQLSERTMSMADRVSFMEAKKKELDSFFQNDVWIYDDAANAPKERILKAHFILKWSKWPNGEPRAKARLITQGFRDPDALNGVVTTSSPTLSRLAKNFMLNVAATMGWRVFSSDVATVFLQGKEHPESRTLWIQLPADARKILGVQSPTSVMRLRKPMYGLVDAPRAWYLEARERVTSLGTVPHSWSMIRHRGAS